MQKKTKKTELKVTKVFGPPSIAVGKAFRIRQSDVKKFIDKGILKV